MKILVVSDTHGNFFNFKKAVETHRDAQIIIHCGDSRDELDDIKMMYPDKAFFCVKGNCDFGSTLPLVEERVVETKKLFITHGHLYNNKMSLYPICCAAREEKADIVIFGHTHNAVADYDDGLYILNPGSLGGYGATYAIIDVSEQGIVTNIVKLK